MIAIRRGSTILLLFFCVSSMSLAGTVSPLRIMAGPERSSQLQIARELASSVGPITGARTQVIATAGTVDTLFRLRDERGIGLGLLSADTAVAYQAAAARGFGEAAALLSPLRVIASLQLASFHFLVRADAGYSGIDALRGARINLGPAKGSSALSVTTLYRQMFGEAIADDKASFLSHEEALAKLVTDRSIDVVAIVAEQPVRLIADMKPDARRYVRLLAMAATRVGDPKVSPVYSTDRLLAGNYPSLLDNDLETAAVRTVLVAHEQRRGDEDAVLVALAGAMCDHLPRLKREGHPGWQAVDFVPPRPGTGWHYASAEVLNEIGRCASVMPSGLLPAACTAEDRALRICD